MLEPQQSCNSPQKSITYIVGYHNKDAKELQEKVRKAKNKDNMIYFTLHSNKKKIYPSLSKVVTFHYINK